jgi:signal transduction histidine kinase
MKLSFRLAAAFVAFVVLGSLALVLWMRQAELQQSRDRFLASANSNAFFIREAKLPPTERTAESLKALLGVTVQFYQPASEAKWVPGPNFALGAKLSGPDQPPHMPDVSPGLHVIAGFWEMAVAEVREGTFLTLLRNPEGAALPRSRTLAVLAVFWGFSLALAWALSSGIVRPLRALAARMPRIAEEGDEPLPEAARTDEIGQLARAYADTRAQLAAERTAREQAERLATLGKMATGLAHEINNPVAAIKLHAQLMESDTGVPPVPTVATTGDPQTSNELSPSHTGHRRDARATFSDRLAIILAETAKIESLVSQWMFLARPQPPQIVECDFAEILAESIRTHTPAAEYAGVKITNEVPPGCNIRADRRRLSQAIANVLTNAIHAMSAGGGALRVMTNDECRMTKEFTGGAFVISFHDSGPGFSAAALARATDLFFSEKEGGMGIGLSVTAEILKAHGGELRLVNAPGGGAMVTMILPRADGPAGGPTSNVKLQTPNF